VKNRLSSYSIAILVGLSALTTVAVFHDPFASKVTGSVTLHSGTIGTSSAPLQTPSLVQNQSTGTGLLTHGTTPQHPSFSHGDDDGNGGTVANSLNGTRSDD